MLEIEKDSLQQVSNFSPQNFQPNQLLLALYVAGFEKECNDLQALLRRIDSTIETDISKYTDDVLFNIMGFLYILGYLSELQEWNKLFLKSSDSDISDISTDVGKNSENCLTQDYEVEKIRLRGKISFRDFFRFLVVSC